jgi:hypothetical protein
MSITFLPSGLYVRIHGDILAVSFDIICACILFILSLNFYFRLKFTAYCVFIYIAIITMSKNAFKILFLSFRPFLYQLCLKSSFCNHILVPEYHNFLKFVLCFSPDYIP